MKSPPHEAVRLILTGGVALAAAAGVARAEWTKTYAVEWNEPAFYYGSEGGPADPGADCPDGVNPDPDWVEILVKAGYERVTAKWFLHPDNRTLTPRQRLNQMAFRGENRANVYADPTTAPDPGFVEVSGEIGEGIDLDGDKSTGFTSPTGEKGIDNNFYRAVGCWKFYRGEPRTSATFIASNNNANSGVWTLVMVVSGKGDDPMNDEDVSLGVYLSSDQLSKNGAGDIARDYTFRIKPHWKYEALFKGKVVDGRITTETSPAVFVRDAGFGNGLELLQARADFEMQPDGGLKGYLGGYRPWAPLYEEWLKKRGWAFESNAGVELPALWYALRRNSTYSPTGPGGEKTHISYALRVDAVPAYVTEPDGKTLVSSVKSYKSVAPEDEPLISYPAESSRKYRTVDGLDVQEGQTAVKPLSDEELRPPAAWLESAALVEARTQ
ncbi:MAG: hypothetical protein AB7P23_04095 [Amphiplicatus sp.]